MVRAVLVAAALVVTSTANGQVGACCYADAGEAACAALSEADCTSQGGVFLGEATTCASTVCQVREWSLVLDDDEDTIVLDRFDTIQQSRRLLAVASRINVTSTHEIQLAVHPSRMRCVTSQQSRIDVRAFIDADAPSIGVFPKMTPLLIDSGYPWMPGPDAPLYCGDPNVDPNQPVLCPADQGGPTACDYGGAFQYLGSDSFEQIEGDELSAYSFDGLNTFEVTITGSGFFIPYASLTIFTNPVNQAQGVMILGYSYLLLEGACCLSDGSCSIDTNPECMAKGGQYQGNFIECGKTDVCHGACCLSGQGCVIMSVDACTAAGGNFLGSGSSCDPPTDCPGACCFQGGSCFQSTEAACQEDCGTFLGPGSTCGLSCPFVSPGACCLSDGSCMEICPKECDALGGVYQGALSRCNLVTCEPFDACPADLDGNDLVDVFDLLIMLDAWGACGTPCPPGCLGDIATADGLGEDCAVGVFDLLELLAEWGVCPSSD